MRSLYVLVAALLLVALTACAAKTPDESAASSEPAVTSIAIEEASSQYTETFAAEPIVPEREIELVAKTLRGECYDDEEDDKREVVRVICNRVSVGGFGDSIEAVIKKPHQFVGYRSGNEPTASDWRIVCEVLTAWYIGRCNPLSEYLYFSSGSGHKNIFRKYWKVSS